MEIKTFIEKFATQLEESNLQEINADTKFRDIEEWSSLMALSVMAMIEEEYNVKIKGDDILNSNTIMDLFEKVKSKT